MTARSADVVFEDESRVFPLLHSGQRVRLHAGGPATELTSLFGVVIGPDETDGHYLIHLDLPARYYKSDGTCEPLPDVVEASDNVEILEDAAR